MTNLVITGVNYKKAALEMRNKFAFNTEQIKKIYSEADGVTLKDFFILSTCNRTEIYSTCSKSDTLLDLFRSNNNLTDEEIDTYCFVKSGDEAILHLLRVASGLDSQILGDYEIIGQLKNAFGLAKEYNIVGGCLEKLVNASLQASREIKNKTSLSDGTTSVSYAAIQLLKELNSEESLNIVLFGLGKIGTLTLKNLKNYLPQHQVTVVNRNEDKAQLAANKYMVNHVSFSDPSEAFEKAHILIVATGADKPILFKRDIEQTPIKMIFDLSVPSNIGSDIKEMEGITTFNIDELSQIVNQTIEQRKRQIPAAEAIILEHFNEFRSWEKRRNLYTTKGEVQIQYSAARA